MKRTTITLAFAIAVMSFFAFTWNAENIYEDLEDVNSASEFLFTSENEDLKANLTDAFSHLFDEIEIVNTHFGTESGYYYVLFGKKEGKALVQEIIVSEDLALSQYFPSREELGVQEDLAVATCYWRKVSFIWVCSTVVTARRICGYTVGGVCIPFDIIN